MADWTDDENEAVVAEYFHMLDAELAGDEYVKREINERVQTATGRSHGSVEYKFQNVSAVLDEAGLPWVSGYMPASNYQAALKPVVLREAARRGLSADRGGSDSRSQHKLALLLPSDPLETLEVYEAFLRKRGLALWRTGDRRRRTWVDEIPIPLSLYFFFESVIRYRARCVAISTSDPYGLEAVPPAYHDDPKKYILFFAMTQLEPLEALHISAFEKWDARGERYTRGNQGIYKVVDPF